MKLLMLPNDILFYITQFLPVAEKMAIRETCIEMNTAVNYMDIKIEKMNKKINKLITGRIYILCRLRLAALCGLNQHTVADIWSWATSIGDIESDALPILREIGRAIYKNS